jgi:hypothetical protein
MAFAPGHTGLSAVVCIEQALALPVNAVQASVAWVWSYVPVATQS